MKKKPIDILLEQLDATKDCVVVYTDKEGKSRVLADTRKAERENNEDR